MRVTTLARIAREIGTRNADGMMTRGVRELVEHAASRRATRFVGHVLKDLARYAANRQHMKDYLLNYHERTGRPQDKLVAFDVWWVHDKSPAPGETHGKPQKPVLLASVGKVTDSGATPWLGAEDATSALP